MKGVVGNTGSTTPSSPRQKKTQPSAKIGQLAGPRGRGSLAAPALLFSVVAITTDTYRARPAVAMLDATELRRTSMSSEVLADSARTRAWTRWKDDKDRAPG
jgi:hypothetical protein